MEPIYFNLSNAFVFFHLGNSNLVYTIIRKRQVFHSLANLPTDCGTINKCLSRRIKKNANETTAEEISPETPSMEGSKPAQPAEPGTLKATLMETPGNSSFLHKNKILFSEL